MRKVGNSLIGLLVINTFLISCFQSEYTKMVLEEREKGIIYDSIFLNFKFGYSKKQFFSEGWEQNKMGLIKHGPRNQRVLYTLNPKDSLSSPIQMLFYPDFDKNDRIKKMDIDFRYTAWAPWNRRYFSDSLLVAVQDTLLNWYGGNDFLLVQYDQEPRKVWVKVDGNRRISMRITNEQEVAAVISDLSNPEYSELTK